MPQPSFTLNTDPSLLFRLRNWEDRATWSEFYRLYYQFIFGAARRSGLSHADAEEVTQDVFKRTAETIHQFESDPERGRFRGWIMTLARWRISDKFRARHPHEKQPPPALGAVQEDGPPNWVEELPDGRDARSVWESEWRRQVVEAALTRLARRVPAKQFQAFDLYHRRNWPVLRISRELGVNPASVYLTNHRLTQLLKTEVRRLEEQLH